MLTLDKMPMETVGNLALLPPAEPLDKSVTMSDSLERISEEDQSHRDTVHVKQHFSNC